MEKHLISKELDDLLLLDSNLDNAKKSMLKVLEHRVNEIKSKLNPISTPTVTINSLFQPCKPKEPLTKRPKGITFRFSACLKCRDYRCEEKGVKFKSLTQLMAHKNLDKYRYLKERLCKAIKRYTREFTRTRGHTRAINVK
jgi:hypothetical protein